MKKKVLVVIAAAALIITTFKTGYAYYESQTKAMDKQNLTTTLDYVNTQNQNQDTSKVVSEETTKEVLEETTKEVLEETTADASSATNNFDPNEISNLNAEDSSGEEEFFGGCCGSGAYSMLDENGNFKTPEVYENELNEGVKNGELTEEDKEYFLEFYKECYGFYSDNSQELTGDEF